MAIRKAELDDHVEDDAPDASGWPYPIQERTLKVAADGSLRLPATFARMFALEGDEVTVRLFSDGHIEMDVPEGRHAPIARMTDELREAMEDVRAGRVTRHATTDDFIASLEVRSR